jgi:glutamine synthetase
MYPEESPFCTSKEGFADLLACIDLSTFRRIPWENNLPFFLVSFYDSKDKSPLKICPRNLLKGVVEKIETGLGSTGVAGLEFEVGTATDAVSGHPADLAVPHASTFISTRLLKDLQTKGSPT